MMIIQFFVTDTEIAQFFEECGYKSKTCNLPKYRQVTHGRGEVVDIPALHVMISKDESVDAKKLFEQTIKAQLMKTDLSAKLAIKKAIKTIKNQ